MAEIDKLTLLYGQEAIVAPSYPTGYEITIPTTTVAENGTYIVPIFLADLPDAWWVDCSGDSDVYVTDDNNAVLKYTIERFDKPSKGGIAWVKTALSTSVASKVRVYRGKASVVDSTLWSDLGYSPRYSLDNAIASGGAYNLTNSGSVEFGGGKIGLGAVFNDSAAKVLSNADALNFERTQPWTISWFGTISALAKLDIILSRGTNNVSPYQGIHIYHDGSNKLVISLVNNYATNRLAYVDNAAYTDLNTWHHWQIVYAGDSETVNCYLNGAARPFTRTVNTLTGSILNSQPFRIGNSDYTGMKYSGSVDEMRIRTVAITADRALTEYKLLNHPTAAAYTVGDEVSITAPRRQGSGPFRAPSFSKGPYR